MPDTKKPKASEKEQSPNPKRSGHPTRDTRDNPAPNPNGNDDMELPDTSTREEIKRIRPNMKR